MESIIDVKIFEYDKRKINALWQQYKYNECRSKNKLYVKLLENESDFKFLYLVENYIKPITFIKRSYISEVSTEGWGEFKVALLNIVSEENGFRFDYDNQGRYWAPVKINGNLHTSDKEALYYFIRGFYEKLVEENLI